MININHLEIAAIGDKELITGLRLAGVNNYYIKRDECNVRDEVRSFFNKSAASLKIGIIVIQEDYTEYITDLINKVRESKNATPVIIEVPSRSGTRYPDIKSYYKSYLKKFIGFDVEI
ncbi:MAG: V-type ATP synthase subunit F [Chloroflexi bacterium]|nr:V-type ATP synthase subunit F [Chloroflexota bacterium]